MLVDQDHPQVIIAQNFWRFWRRPAWDLVRIAAFVALPFLIVWLFWQFGVNA